MIQAIVTDIEGTTSSLSFVKDVLFPYAREHLAAYVRAHAAEPPVRALLDEACQAAGRDMDDEAVIAQLIAWIDADRKVTPLKALQGLIWEAGYRDGAFQGHIYADAVAALQHWHAQGIRLYVYSSGSIKAQQQLFAHTAYGDLTPLFTGYFDTRIGAKTEQAAYQRIVEAIGVPAGQVLFLSDVVGELDAARGAGMRTTWLCRDGLPAESGDHTVVTDFSAIDPGRANP